jgi:hypothetical protein
MRIANRPLFYVILLLLAAMALLTAYLVWKVPEAEELRRAQKKPSTAPLPASQP